MKRNILLTGAAGSVGLETLKQLVSAGYNVTAFDRDTERNHKILYKFRDKARIILDDICDPKAVEKAVIGQDVAIHLAAVIPPKADKDHALAERVNHGGTINIVDAINKVNPLCFLVYASSISIYGDRIKNPDINTTDLPNPSLGDFYATTKVSAENYIRKNCKYFTIFRFTGIMGRPRLGQLMFHMALDTILEIITVPDAARALVNAIMHIEELAGGTYDISGGEKCETTYHEFLVEMFKRYGLLPAFIVKWSFATANFHCGRLLDGNVAESILHFRQDSLDDYLDTIEAGTNKLVKVLAQMLSLIIVPVLMISSGPLWARLLRIKKYTKRFFGS